MPFSAALVSYETTKIKYKKRKKYSNTIILVRANSIKNCHTIQEVIKYLFITHLNQLNQLQILKLTPEVCFFLTHC